MIRAVLVAAVVLACSATVATATPIASLQDFVAVSGGNAQFASGSTLWFNPFTGGSVRVRINATDGGVGMDHVSFPAPGLGWTPPAPTDDLPGSPYSVTYAWSNGAMTPGTLTAVAVSNDLSSTPVTVTLQGDGAPPIDGSITYPDGFTNGATTTIDFDPGVDAGSGVKSWSLQRQDAPLSDGLCGSFGLWSDLSLKGTSPYVDATIADGTCYRYEVFTHDNVNNAAPFTSAATVKVDRAAPSGTIAADPIGPIHGEVVLSGSSSSAASGVQQVSVDYMGPASGNVCLESTTPTAWSCSWNTSGLTDGLYMIMSTITDFAGNSSSVTRTLAVDNTTPSGGLLTYPDGASAATSVSVAFLLGMDTGSGLADHTLERRSAPLLSSACDSWTTWSSLASSPTSPYVDATIADATCYQYRLVVQDAAGNSTTTLSSDTVKVDRTPGGDPTDTTPPSISIAGWTAVTGAQYQHTSHGRLYINPAHAGSAQLALTASDAGSGMASVTFPDLGAGFTQDATTVASLPYVATYIWSAGVSSPGARHPLATDVAGNLTQGSLTVLVDATAPLSAQLNVPDGAASGAVAVSWIPPVDSGSGVGTIQLLRASAPYAGGRCGNFGTYDALGAPNPTLPYADATIADGTCSKYRIAATDNVGNTATFGSTSVVRVDNTAPTGANITSAPGANADGQVVVTFATGGDRGSGLAGWQVERATASYSNGSCGTAGAWNPVGLDRTASPLIDTAVPLATCAWYRVVVRDGAGNVTTVAAAEPSRVAATLPVRAPDPRLIEPTPPPPPTAPTPRAATGLRATSGPDTVRFGRGKHTFNALGGNDSVRGGPAVDLLHGGAGNDHLWGNAGRDSLFGDAGRDWLFGGSGADRLYGGAGNDHLDGGAGNDRLVGGAGRDVVIGGAGNDTIDVRDGTGGDVVRCGTGHDTVRADVGDRIARDCESIRRH